MPVTLVFLLSYTGDGWFYIFNWFSWLPFRCNTISVCFEGLCIQKPALLDSVTLWLVRHDRFDYGLEIEPKIRYTRLFLCSDS